VSEPVTVPAEWAELIDDFLTWLSAGGRSPGTAHLRRLWLMRYARVAPASPADTTTEHLAAFLSSSDWAPETRRSAVASLRNLFRWAVRAGRLKSDPTLLLATVRAPAGQPRPIPDEVLNDALVRAKPSTRLMLLLAAYAGLRRAEIAAVHTDDVANGRLRVRGKGGRVREVPLHPLIATELSAAPPGYVFPGKIDGHLSADRVGCIVADALPGNWTAHTLRHRFATQAYAVERDLLAVQELLGHTAPETTRRYTAVPEGARERAVRGLPYASATANSADDGGARTPKPLTAPPRAEPTKVKAVVAVDDLEVQRLRRAVDAAERNSLKCWLWLYAAGFSAGEIARLRIGDVRLDERQILVDGRRARVVRIPAPLVAPLTAYLGRVREVFGPAVAADDDLFFWKESGARRVDGGNGVVLVFGEGPRRLGRMRGSSIEVFCRDHLRHSGIRNGTAALKQLPALLQ
jgi:integrase